MRIVHRVLSIADIVVHIINGGNFRLSGYQKIRQWMDSTSSPHVSGYRSIRIKGNGYSVAVRLGMAYAIALLVTLDV
jgi:hypothetical protein